MGDKEPHIEKIVVIEQRKFLVLLRNFDSLVNENKKIKITC